MKVTMHGYLRVHMTTEVDTNDEDVAYEEASGRLYDGLCVLLHVPNADFDWEFDDAIALEMDVEKEDM